MEKNHVVITGIGAVSSCGLGKEIFWKKTESGKNCLRKPKKLGYSGIAGEVDGKLLLKYLGEKGLRNLDKSAVMLLAVSGLALSDAKLEINEKNTDRIGVSTGTTFSHLEPIIEFDREVFKETINFTSPALFPSTVLNAASSQVSIKYNIQGLNTTVSTAFTSSLEAMQYAVIAIESGNADIVIAGGVDPLSKPVLFGLKKLGYLAGIKGPDISCPFDLRRNGPVPGEGAGMLCLESAKSAAERKVKPYARLLGLGSCFDPKGVTKVFPRGDGMEFSIREALEKSGKNVKDIDYISSCANSTRDLDKVEVKVLKRIFGGRLAKIPVSSIKSMIGETFSASGALQMISCIGAMHRGILPPTINYRKKDPLCEIDCVPNTPRKKKIKIALVISSGPGGYNSACLLEKI